MIPWRAVLTIAIALAVVLLLNFITVRTLLATHPARRTAIWTAAVLCNFMWLMLPLLFTARTATPIRFLRAFLGPPWFGWMIFIILYSSVAVLLFVIWFALARQRMPFGEFAHHPSTIFLSVLGVLTLIGYYQALVPLRIERVSVQIGNLPGSLRGYRIAVISDLHVGLFTRLSRLERISREINKLDARLLAITGDLVDDDPYFVPKLLRGLESIRPETNMFAVLGNHEIYGDPLGVIRSLDGSRVRLLVNQGLLLPEGLWLAGISDYAAGGRLTPATAHLRPNMGEALKGSGDATVILLSHQPRAFDEARERRVPLTICGHTHGGQFGIRPLGWSLAGVFLPYHMGLYERDGTQMYVNTGTGYWVVPFRLGMTPEITLIELTP